MQYTGEHNDPCWGLLVVGALAIMFILCLYESQKFTFLIIFSGKHTTEINYSFNAVQRVLTTTSGRKNSYRICRWTRSVAGQSSRLGKAVENLQHFWGTKVAETGTRTASGLFPRAVSGPKPTHKSLFILESCRAPPPETPLATTWHWQWYWSLKENVKVWSQFWHKKR